MPRVWVGGRGLRAGSGSTRACAGLSAGGRGFGCSGLVLAALAGLSGLQSKPKDPLLVVFLSITTGCTLQTMSHLSSLSKLSMAGGVIRG